MWVSFTFLIRIAFPRHSFIYLGHFLACGFFRYLWHSYKINLPPMLDETLSRRVQVRTKSQYFDKYDKRPERKGSLDTSKIVADEIRSLHKVTNHGASELIRRQSFYVYRWENYISCFLIQSEAKIAVQANLS